MRNIFVFLRRFSYLLSFLILQVVAIGLLVSYNRSHEAAYLQFSYEITGKINKQANKVETWLSLGDNNKRLAQENTDLKNNLPYNFISLDTTGRVVMDSVKWDSTGMQRKYFYRTARVVNNSVAFQTNTITIERGTAQGVTKGQAVTCAGGIVGIVTDASSNYAIVMSLLNRNSRQSVMMKYSNAWGTLTWDGKNPTLLQLSGIGKSTKVAKGDTVLSSNLSMAFPAGLMVGTIEKVELEQGGNNYLLQIKPGANFSSLQYVDVIENTFAKQQAELEAKAKKQ